MAKRRYENPYPSVTQVLGILRKIGLEYWFKNNTAQFCDDESRKGKTIGTQIHQGIEDHIELREISIETEYTGEVMNALKGFMKFKKDHPDIVLKKAEIILTSEKFKYNGMMDCLGIKSGLVLFDWKTGKCKDKEKPPVYDEHRYQVSAYYRAYNELNKEKLIKAYILVLAKDQVAYTLEELVPDQLNELFEEVFLPALRICNFQRKK